MSWYDCVKPKYGKKAKLCYMDTDSSIVYIKTWYLRKYFRRFRNKIWHFILWIRKAFAKRKIWKSNWINKIWIRQKNHDKVC